MTANTQQPSDDWLDDYPTTPVPESRFTSGFRICLIISAVSFALPNLVAGLELGSRLGVGTSLAAFLTGGLVLALISFVTGLVGTLNRLSSYMIIQFVFGRQGAKLVNLMFAVAMLGWFGINIDLLSQALISIFEAGEKSVWLFEVTGGAIITITTLFGVRLINGLSTLFVPVLVAVCLYLLSQVLGAGNDPVVPSTAQEPLTYGEAVSAVVGGLIVGSVLLPDFTRFIRKPSHMWLVAAVPFLIVEPFVLTIAAISGEVTGESDALTMMLAMGLGWGAFLLVIMSSWILNSMNLYSCSLSVASVFPRGTEWKQVVILGIAGTLAASFNLLDYLVTFLFYLAITFAPVAGIYVVDFFLLKRCRPYDVSRLSSIDSVNWAAIVAWGFGIWASILSAEMGISLTTIEACDAVLSSMVVYGVMSELMKKVSGKELSV